ncbi:MAG: type II toxin-antitoxin system ParD family antitoxin [Xanthobacteraceae bacterium]
MPFSVDLGNKLEAFVAKLVKSGRYNSKSEVLREGIRLVQERETRLAALEAALARGLADAEAGRVTPAETVFAELRAKYRAMAEKAESHEARPDRRGARGSRPHR